MSAIPFQCWYDAEVSLEDVKAQCAHEVQEQAEAFADLLDLPVARPPQRDRQRVNGRFVSNDGHASSVPEWDWYWQLSDEERVRLRDWFSDNGLAPDQWTAALATRVGENVEGAMNEWRLATALADAGRLLRRGRLPRFQFRAQTTYELADVFGDDAVTQLARWYMELSE